MSSTNSGSSGSSDSRVLGAAASAVVSPGSSGSSNDAAAVVHPQPNSKNKRPRLMIGNNDDDDDLVILVADKTFKANSHFLRAASGYFAAAFRTGMKESRLMRFEFPDKSPEEWELLMAILDPFNAKTVTEENSRKLLPWFDELCIRGGLKACDRLFCREILSKLLPKGNNFGLEISRKDLNKILSLLETSNTYDLQSTREACLEKIGTVWKENPCLMGPKHIDQLWSLVRDLDADSRKTVMEALQEVMESLKTKLDNPIRTDFDALVKSELLPSFLNSCLREVENAQKVKELEDFKEVALRLASAGNFESSADRLKRRCEAICQAGSEGQGAVEAHSWSGITPSSPRRS